MAAAGGYRYEATTVEGFVQQLAVCYLKNRYWFYVLGEVPAGKDPHKVDGKLLARYGVEQSKWAKARSRRRGSAKVQYLRYQTTFVIVSTQGEHPLFEDERDNIRDVRERPIQFYGYSIGYRDGRVHVRIATDQYRELARAFLGSALTASADTLAARFRSLPFEPYGPVKVQLRQLLHRVNDARRAAGLARLDVDVVRTKRRTVRPFCPGPDERIQEPRHPITGHAGAAGIRQGLNQGGEKP